MKFEEAESKRLEAEKIAAEEAKKAQHRTTTLMHHHSMIIEEKELVELERQVLERKQQDLMDESHEMIDCLKEQVSKQKEINIQLTSEIELLKENNKRLIEANASSGASLHVLNQMSKKLMEANAKLTSQVSKLTCKLRSFEVAQKPVPISSSPTSVLQLPSSYDENQKEKSNVNSESKYQDAFDQIIKLVKNGQEDEELVDNISRVYNQCVKEEEQDSMFPAVSTPKKDTAVNKSDVTPDNIQTSSTKDNISNPSDPDTPQESKVMTQYVYKKEKQNEREEEFKLVTKSSNSKDKDVDDGISSFEMKKDIELINDNKSSFCGVELIFGF